MATLGDAEEARRIIVDSLMLLDWSAGSDSILYGDGGRDGGTSQVVSDDELRQSFGPAVDQLAESQGRLALLTLSGDNPAFPMEQVLELLAAVGWDGALLTFKLRTLSVSGREEVMETARRGRSGGGQIRRRIFRRFLPALNAALGSLSGLPGVGAVQEVKNFLEAASSD
jgi:hypothetical protein